MCRHAVYLGSPIPLSHLLFDPPHSLEHQSYAPSDPRQGGSINADGFGVGWYLGAKALRYRSAAPIWADADFAAIAAAIQSGTILAAVRSATIGMPIVATAAAPFTDGRLLFSFNGFISGWPDSVAGIAARLPVAELLGLDAPTDAAFLWTLLRHRLREAAPAEAVAEILSEVAAAAPDSRLNLMFTDGAFAVATTWWHSLSLRHNDSGVTIASEPLDSGNDWKSIPDRKLIVADTAQATVTTLPFETGNR